MTEKSEGGVRLSLLKTEWRVVGAALGVGLLVRLILAPYRGFFSDFQLYLTWANTFIHHPFDFYSVSISNYPPLTIYLFAITTGIYTLFAHVFHLPEGQALLQLPDQYSPIWAFLKLPILAADLGAGAMIYVLARAVLVPKWAAAAALGYLLAPTVLLDGAVWGQTDGMPVFFLLAALVSLFAGRYGWAGVMIALAVLIKPQPLIFAPILLLYIWRWRGQQAALRTAVAGVVAAVVTCAPFLLPHFIPPHPAHLQMFIWYYNTLSAYAGFPLASANAFNLWYLINLNLTYQQHVLGPLTPTVLGALLYAPFFLLALVAVWRDRRPATLYIALSLAAVGFFDLTALQHERYMYPALAFLLLAAVFQRTHLAWALLGNVLTFVNFAFVILEYGIRFGGGAGVSGLIPLSNFVSLHPEIATGACWGDLLLMAALVGVLVWDLWAARRQAPAAPAAESASNLVASRQVQ